jgi:hypothetical protein
MRWPRTETGCTRRPRPWEEGPELRRRSRRTTRSRPTSAHRSTRIRRPANALHSLRSRLPSCSRRRCCPSRCCWGSRCWLPHWSSARDRDYRRLAPPRSQQTSPRDRLHRGSPARARTNRSRMRPIQSSSPPQRASAWLFETTQVVERGNGLARHGRGFPLPQPHTIAFEPSRADMFFSQQSCPLRIEIMTIARHRLFVCRRGVPNGPPVLSLRF